MKEKLLAIIGTAIVILSFAFLPTDVLAAGVGPTSGGSYMVGQTFTIDIIASGTTFNAFQGNINVSGPASYSINPGNAIWDPSNTISGNGNHFDGGIASAASSFTIASVTIRGTSVGTGYVSVSGVELINDGNIVSTGGGSTSFTITRVPTPPGTISVTSSTNPNQTQTYGVTAAQFSWSAPANGATGYSYVFDQTSTTAPSETQNTTATTASFSSLGLGTYYFHIRAVNGDGWGPVTTYKINIGRVLNSTLHTPIITNVKKLSNFSENITTGTLTNMEIEGTAKGLAGYTITLTFTPANLPAAQVLTTTANKSGNWNITLNQAVPAGFYNVTAVATQNQTTTPASTPVNIELSLANGGTAKIITAADLPKPDLTVKKWGIVFATRAQYHKVLGVVTAIVIGSILVCFGIYFLATFLVKKYLAKNKMRKSATPPASAPPLIKNLQDY